MSDLDLDALEASYTNTSRIAEKDVYALIAKAREAEGLRTKTQTVCGACGEPWTGQSCGQQDNAHPFPVCYPYQTENGSQDFISQEEVMGLIGERDNYAKQRDEARADLATARAQLATARAALEPFAKRSNYLGTTADDVTHWHPAVGSPVSAGDLHRAREALSQLPYIIAGLATAAVAAGAVWGYVGMMARHA